MSPTAVRCPPPPPAAVATRADDLPDPVGDLLAAVLGPGEALTGMLAAGIMPPTAGDGPGPT